MKHFDLNLSYLINGSCTLVAAEKQELKLEKVAKYWDQRSEQTNS